MKISHIKFPSKNGALLGYIANKRTNLAHYIRKINDHSGGRLSTSYLWQKEQ